MRTETGPMPSIVLMGLNSEKPSVLADQNSLYEILLISYTPTFLGLKSFSHHISLNPPCIYKPFHYKVELKSKSKFNNANGLN